MLLLCYNRMFVCLSVCLFVCTDTARSKSTTSFSIRGHPFMTSTRRGEGGQAQMDACHRKLKLESTDVILSSSHAKKLASFLPEFRLWTEKKCKFFCDIN